MTIRTIAVALFDKTNAEWLIPLACETARTFDAHLIGVHPYQPVSVYFGPDGDIAYMQIVREMRDTETREIQALFADAIRKADVRAELRSQKEASGTAETYLLAAVRGADIVVMAPTGRDPRNPSTDDLSRTLVRHSGRPVLVMPPETGLAAAPERILVGWSDTREATRAAHDALTLAAPGAAIDLLAIGERQDIPDSREDLASAFDRLGYRVTLLDRDSSRGERGEALLEAAVERDSQLVVTGAFGHSPLYDFVIGAVTTHLLEHTKLPVLLSK